MSSLPKSCRRFWSLIFKVEDTTLLHEHVQPVSEVVELVLGELTLAPISLGLSSDHDSWVEFVGV